MLRWNSPVYIVVSLCSVSFLGSMKWLEHLWPLKIKNYYLILKQNSNFCGIPRNSVLFERGIWYAISYKFFLTFGVICVIYVYLSVRMCSVSPGALDSQLELHIALNCLTWLLRTELGSFGKAANTVNHWAIPPVPHSQHLPEVLL